MPSRNTVKEFAQDQYYHVYNRGIEKRIIFADDQDYAVFLGLLKKYLSGENHNRKNRHVFKPIGDKVQLLAYCLMPNHFHLLLYQTDQEGVTQLMRRVCTGYVMYFNDRYKREGRLFQGSYKASLVDKDGYLHHISRYIHLNPKEYDTWLYSSLEFYKGNKHAAWVNEKPILELFAGSRKLYLEFVNDYVAGEGETRLINLQLANSTSDM